MFERNVYDQYGLYCDSRFALGDFEGFEAGGNSYVFFPKEDCASKEQEMLDYAEYYRSIGDASMLTLQKTKSNGNVGLIDGQEVYLFAMPEPERNGGLHLESSYDIGGHLATIHYYGKQMPQMRKSHDYFGQWHKLWEKRLEQLEGWYQQISYEQPRSYVDEAFLYSYPYYMGLTENAIQYAVDARLDDPTHDKEQGTVCHRRFTDQTWLVTSTRGGIIKRPTEFVYDHPCRDIAEWIRQKRYDQALSRNNNWEDVHSFIEGYEQYEPLSTYAWRLTYARLLFPVHYFESIENYYRAQINEDKQEHGQVFFSLIEQEGENEQFLKQFSEMIRIPKTSSRTPNVEWL
ncbi:spore coat protein YutH [Alkalihalophilus pseudofirmus]|uniref:spore coat putative kinase YutH n=1 Tax=Alkalihalophilus pseudofirmus TaxID=79885 RepID=UPI0009510D6E|nr:spore coat protein YutH [Alkalihalophilus pseudofirmus]